MALQQIIDATTDFNANGSYVIDCGGYDYAEVQVVNPSADVNFSTSIDSGAVQGVSDGNYKSATNFVAVLGTNLTTGTTAVKATASSIFKFINAAKYLQLDSSDTAEKILIRLYKIS